MSSILIADIHLNEKSQDEYRWGLFDWLYEQKADEIIICGDLTDAKDRHSAKLVNKLHQSIIKLATKFHIIILKGNHDWLADPKSPFFEFLGNQTNIVFVKEPTIIKLSIGQATFVPAGEKWNFKLHKTPYLFTHATFNGAVAENGTTLTGVDPHVLDDYDGYVYSGDIHVPQRLHKGKITYIGAPYHTRFGDQFEPRVLKLDNEGYEQDLFFPAPKKRTFQISKPEDLEEVEADKGDHVKVKCHLRRTEYTEWKKYKAEIRVIATEREWQLYGVEPVPIEITPAKDDPMKQQTFISSDELLLKYAKEYKVGENHLRIGRELLKD